MIRKSWQQPETCSIRTFFQVNLSLYDLSIRRYRRATISLLLFLPINVTISSLFINVLNQYWPTVASNTTQLSARVYSVNARHAFIRMQILEGSVQWKKMKVNTILLLNDLEFPQRAASHSITLAWCWSNSEMQADWRLLLETLEQSCSDSDSLFIAICQSQTTVFIFALLNLNWSTHRVTPMENKTISS